MEFWPGFGGSGAGWDMDENSFTKAQLIGPEAEVVSDDFYDDVAREEKYDSESDDEFLFQAEDDGAADHDEEMASMDDDVVGITKETPSTTAEAASCTAAEADDGEDCYERDWTRETAAPPVADFTSDSGFKVMFPGPLVATPITYFRLFAAANIELLMKETNHHAHLRQVEDWEDMDVPDMERFIGILILMGLVRIPKLSLYWEDRDDGFNMFRLDSIASRMSESVFARIFRHLHIASSTVPNDRLHKVKRFLENMNAMSESMYDLPADVCVEETMLATKGSYSNQWILRRPLQWAVKLRSVVCPATGYMWRVRMYDGEKQGVSQHGIAHSATMDICDGLFHKSHRLYLDEFSASVPLLMDLLDRGTVATGTIRRDADYLPSQVVKKPLVKRMSLGGSLFRRDESLLCLTWKDKCGAKTYLSTFHNASGSDTVERKVRVGNAPTRTRTQIPVPPCAHDYKKFFEDMQLWDEHCLYSTAHKKTRKWWKIVVFRCLDIAIRNAHVLMQKSQPATRSMSIVAFRERLCEELFGITSEERREKARLSEQHYPRTLDDESYEAQVCHVCAARTKPSETPGETKFGCLDCEPSLALHVIPCFEIWHTEPDILNLSKEYPDPMSDEALECSDSSDLDSDMLEPITDSESEDD